LTTATRKRTERPARVNSLVRKVSEFLAIKFEVTSLTDRQNVLKKELLAEVERHGEVDEKGSQFLELDEPVVIHGQTFRSLKRERRATPVFLQEDAEALLEKKGLLDRVMKEVTTVVFDQDELYLLHQEGLISEEEIDSLFTENESWAFKPLAE
jgi:hypothetical protein